MIHEIPFRPMSQREVDQEMHEFFQVQAERNEKERQSGDARVPVASRGKEADRTVRVPTIEEAKATVARIRADNRDQANQKARLTGLPPISLNASDIHPASKIAVNDQDIASHTSPVLMASTAVASSSTASLPVAARSPVCPDHCFPERLVSRIAEHDDPVDVLEKLCGVIRKPSDYRLARAQYVEISIQVNLSGRLAPAFRRKPKVDAKFGDTVHMLMFRDALVIDYHWCCSTMSELSPRDDAHARLMDPGLEFSFEGAWLLACKKLKGQYRGDEAMGLTTLQQCQTRYLQGPELLMRVAGLSSTYRASGGKFSNRHTVAMRKIREWTERHPRMKTERLVYERLWEARELLGPENGRLIGRLLALMLGDDERDRKTIKSKLGTLDKHIGT